jgi:putative two-component system response regulator
MKSHAKIGAEILIKSPQTMFQVAAKIAGGHHERCDGKGYP